MNETHLNIIAGELNINNKQVQATAALLGEGATVPFIARYRKEATNMLDEVAITTIRDRMEQLAELDKRREAILKSLAERDILTPELEAKINGAENMTTLADIYMPYRVKRRTRATIAREKGLEPLAKILLNQDSRNIVIPENEAATYINKEKGVESVDDALAGARDIIAEQVSEDAPTRESMRELFTNKGTVNSKVLKGKDEEGAKYRDYFEWQESVSSAPSHRVLAMFRGEKEGVLSLRVSPDEDEAIQLLDNRFVKGNLPASMQVKEAIRDGYKRLLAPSIENEIRSEMKRLADEEAIRVFVENLRELLLTSPLGEKSVLALDPGFRTGCKLVCLNAQGKLLHNETIYPHTGGYKAEESGEIVKRLCEKFGIEAIAIGNGTASRETESFVRKIVGLPSSIAVVMVNESGASVYSASEVARDEFPDYDVTVRGAVSIGRRLMDPLAELVKIDPKSIGVGQYQHDVDQTSLRRSLDDTVMSCVNGVGVDVNTASKQLLTYVSGLGPQLAGNIVTYRDENGPFTKRSQLKKVTRLGEKAFEQAAGFLRIRGAENPLDGSAVHPESYSVVDAMAKDLGCTVSDLIHDESLRGKIDLHKYVNDKVGLPTLKDILAELAKPGRDPRDKFEVFSFAEGVEKMEDLVLGMKLPGIVTNVTAFGAFVDIGVHQDGLVHISQMADRFIKDPAEVVKVQQQVEVTVMEVDLQRKRIALSMKKNPDLTDSAKDRPTARKGGKPERKAQRASSGGWFSDALKNGY